MKKLNQNSSDNSKLVILTDRKLNAMEEAVQVMYDSAIVDIPNVVCHADNLLLTNIPEGPVVTVDNHSFEIKRLLAVKPIMKHLVSCLRVFDQPVTFAELSIERTKSLKFWTINDESIERFYTLGIATGVLKNVEGTKDNKLIKRIIEVEKGVF